MVQGHEYWIFSLSPFVFEVRHIPFAWVTTWWGLIGLILFFAGGFWLTKTKLFSSKTNVIIQNVLIYALLIFLILFGLQKFNVNWGLRWYSLMYIIGFFAIYVGCSYWSRKKVLMLTESTLISYITYSIIGMLIGARLTYVFVYDWDLYKDNLWSIFATWQGGLSFHGGIIGVIVATMLFTRANKIPFYHLTDKVVRMVPIGIGFGRLGNFMNGELWGRQISGHVPWAVIFPEGGMVARHPSQLYQSLGEGWLLFFTLYFLSFKPRREGTMSSFFLMFYCIYRFIVEYFREADSQVSYFYLNHFTWAPLGMFPQTNWWLVLTMGQILCLIGFVAGLLMYIFSRNNILEGSPEWLKRNENFFKRVEQTQ